MLVDKAHTEKTHDENTASERKAVWTMDLQAIQLAPKSNANQMYYKTKLGVHNYSFFNKATKEGNCVFWNETDGNVDGRAFVSVQQRHFRRFLNENPNVRGLVIWSDGCNKQTRNQMASCGFVDLAIRSKKVII